MASSLGGGWDEKTVPTYTLTRALSIVAGPFKSPIQTALSTQPCTTCRIHINRSILLHHFCPIKELQ